MRLILLSLVVAGLAVLLAAVACQEEEAVPGVPTEAVTSTPAPAIEGEPEPTAEPALAPTPEPAGPATSFGDGTHIVGVDIQPGSYRNSDSSDGCFWERLSGFSGAFEEIIANEFTYSHEVVTIKETDAGFSTGGCGTWTPALSAVTDSPTGPFSDGVYVVGRDIAPGTWRNEGSEGCYWERLSGFTGEFEELLANDFTDSPTIVTISASDAGFSTDNCGTWTKVD